jgi:hypothetical protein
MENQYQNPDFWCPVDHPIFENNEVSGAEAFSVRMFLLLVASQQCWKRLTA